MRNKIKLLSLMLSIVAFTCQPFVLARGARATNEEMIGTTLRELPDLIVRGVRMGDPTIGEFFVTVQNKGTAAASNCLLRLYVWDKSGKPFAIVEMNQPPIEGNGAFAKVKITADKGLPAYLKYQITTDSSNTVAESNERNNTWSGNTGKV